MKNINFSWRKCIFKNRKIFFRDHFFSKKNLLKSQWKMKISIFRFFLIFFEKSKFSFFIDFSKDFFIENFLVSNNIFSTFSTNFFGHEKKIMDFFLYQSGICSGIQKSYLENRASILKSFKIKNPVFPTQISGFPYTIVQCYVHRPLTLCVSTQ